MGGSCSPSGQKRPESCIWDDLCWRRDSRPTPTGKKSGVGQQITVEIENQKKAARLEVKNQVGTMAIEIAEKLLKKELSGSSEHQSFVNKLVDDIKLN